MKPESICLQDIITAAKEAYVPEDTYLPISFSIHKYPLELNISFSKNAQTLPGYKDRYTIRLMSRNHGMCIKNINIDAVIFPNIDTRDKFFNLIMLRLATGEIGMCSLFEKCFEWLISENRGMLTYSITTELVGEANKLFHDDSLGSNRFFAIDISDLWKESDPL